MKLELKHLAPYLPYGLRCNLMGEHTKETEYNENPTAKVFLIEGANTKSVEVWSNKTITDEWDYNEVFPLLRPLSDLTKEIQIKDSLFIPAEILFSVDSDEIQNFKDFGEIPSHWKDSLKIKPLWYNYYQIKLLFEWHFDVFGLIEKGLAIDINTL